MTSPSLTAVVLAHSDPAHLRRLVDALEGVPVFLHCDAKAPETTFSAMVTGMPDRVRMLDRRPTSLASWSLVGAELAGVRRALEETTAGHVAVLSGSDYPLVSMTRLAGVLDGLADESLVWNVPMPFPGWDAPRHRDGGMWRLRHRFLVVDDQLVYVKGIPVRWPFRRRLPTGVEFRASTQWKVYSRRHAELLLQVVEERPDLVDFWRTTLVPEETFVASVLASPSLVGSAALSPSSYEPWYTRWPDVRAHHPHWLTVDDLGELTRATREGSGAVGGRQDDTGPRSPLFARKFSSQAADVLNRIDVELRP